MSLAVVEEASKVGMVYILVLQHISLMFSTFGVTVGLLRCRKQK